MEGESGWQSSGDNGIRVGTGATRSFDRSLEYLLLLSGTKGCRDLNLVRRPWRHRVRGGRLCRDEDQWHQQSNYGDAQREKRADIG